MARATVSIATRPRRRRPSRRRASSICTSSISTAPSPASRSTPRRSSASSRRSAIPVQLGGGIRDMATIEGWLGKGVDRVIIGTAAVRDPELVQGSGAARFPGRVAVGLDARDGKVAVAGLGGDVRARRRSTSRGASRMPASPPSSTPTSPATACSRASTSTPPSRSPTRCRIPVIASGGLASIDDVRALLAAACEEARRRDRRPRAL